MTDATREHLNDILAGFRRRYVRQQSVATARCKWDYLSFNPSQRTFPDHLDQYQKLAQEPYGEDAPKFIETSFYAKMPPHLKKVLNQARLETESYKTMVQHLERETELNGLAATDNLPITGVHNLELSLQQQQEKKPQNNRNMLRMWQPSTFATKLSQDQQGQTIPEKPKPNSKHTM